MDLQLKERLRAYVTENNPDLILNLKGEFSIARYLDEKVKFVTPVAQAMASAGRPVDTIEDHCLELMTKDLKPSRFLYIRDILETDFSEHFDQLTEAGVLTYEILNMIELCNTTFLSFGFSEEHKSSEYLHAIISSLIRKYLFPNS